MKLIHISDLHIGKRVNEFPMLEDQKYILRQILAIADAQQADGIMIAGDIYDKPVPSAEAVQVFDWFLTELADRKKQVYAVSGNHDSAERIAFGAQLMCGRGVFVSPVYRGDTAKFTMTDSYGELCLYLLPFVKPAVVRHALQEMSDREETPMPESYHEAVKLAVARMNVDTTKRNILIAHQFVTGAGRCDSEEVSVGGLDNVDADVFDDFDYVALGHIHSPQSLKRETVRYCGTPLKYSFSEAAQEKSVTVVEFREKGNIALSTVPLVPLHDLRKIRGTYLEVTAKSFYQDTDTQDYVQITLTDEEDIPDGLQKLRVIYPNLMRLEYDNSRTRHSRVVERAEEIEQKTELELFAEFYEMQNNQPMSEEQSAFVTRLIEESR
ncbi:MAG: exonuclease SbcCD subunit D [Lachnospiraceae bacterium]|jgi:exonuclease SbcD|nr:exonuclease SbcCD, D subunit [Lachnospiraceae bacterium A4]MCI8974454.1 exonuclease SbcCD subunit D [Lachnospiraceae bacterium]